MAKKNEKGFTAVELMVVILLLVIGIGGVGGWVQNIYKFATADFEESYKEEVIRGIGIPFAPLGAIAGWMTIGDENKRD